MIFGSIPADSVVAETLVLVILLLPGFLALRVRDVFVKVRKRPFKETWLSALLFDLPVFLVLLGIAQHEVWGLTPTLSEGAFNPMTILAALLLAIAIGALSGAVENWRVLRNLLRCLGLSRKGWVGAWADAFLHARDREADWAVVHTKDGSMYHGWPEIISVDGEKPSILLTRQGDDRVSWVTPGGEEFELDGLSIFLTPNSEITRVDFVD